MVTGRTVISPEDVVEEYGESLIEPGEEFRRAILERVWADDCEVMLLGGTLRGRGEINRHITRIRREYGSATPIISSPVQAHSGFVGWEWQVIDPSGEVVGQGANFAEQGEDGRLRRVVVFLN